MLEYKKAEAGLGMFGRVSQTLFRVTEYQILTVSDLKEI